MTTRVSQTIRDLCSVGSPFEHAKPGDVLTHPDGRKVRIVSGQYWGEYGLSNHWCWREVMADGTLGKEESGYGW